MIFDAALPLLILAIVVTGLVLASRTWRPVTIQEFERGLWIHKGAVTRELQPGRYRIWSRATQIVSFDLRERVLGVAGQEMLTSDQLPVRVSLAVNHRITDPRLYRNRHSDPDSRLHGNVQVECRVRVMTRTLDQLLGDRNALTDGFAEKLNADASSMGMEVTRVDLRDITLAGPAKQ